MLNTVLTGNGLILILVRCIPYVCMECMQLVSIEGSSYMYFQNISDSLEISNWALIFDVLHDKQSLFSLEYHKMDEPVKPMQTSVSIFLFH
jgi:hypothetical protein